MTKAQNLQIGDKVKFIRHTLDNIEEGSGRIKAITLDADSRRIVHILNDVPNEDGSEHVFNTFMPCVNPTGEFKVEFREMVKRVDALVLEVNGEIKKLTDGANAEIGALHSELLGVPVKFD